MDNLSNEGRDRTDAVVILTGNFILYLHFNKKAAMKFHYTLITLSLFLIFQSSSLILKSQDAIENSFVPFNSHYFEENVGQIKDQKGNTRDDILFRGKADDLDFHLTRQGISYQLYQHEKSELEIFRVDIKWKDSKTNPELQKEKPLPGSVIYHDSQKSNNRSLKSGQFEEVKFKNIWNGIDLRYYFRDDHLEMDWFIEKAENINQVAMEITGGNVFLTGDNCLTIETPFGTIKEGGLKVIQDEQSVDAEWVLEATENGTLVSFNITGNYDSEKSLIIDPPVFVWGTYYGGAQTDDIKSTVIDDSGNIYFAGTTFGSVGNIATSGAHQTGAGSTTDDAFLLKFNSSGNRLWATYYGGNDYDEGLGCSVDEHQNVYLCGETESTNNIATTNSHQNSIGGGRDGFLVKFDSNGTRQWGTYYGGAATDIARGCWADKGSVYLFGSTSSGTDISTAGAHQSQSGGGSDGFVVKFDSNGNRVWGTYYGGSSNEGIYSCVTDNDNMVYFTGESGSSNNISTQGTHQPVYGGSFDAFIFKMDSMGNRLWGTYYGGNSSDYARSIAIDTSNYLYIAGRTGSSNNISTSGAHQPSFVGPLIDAFLTKFDTSGIQIWGTYYGGGGNDFGESCVVDGVNNIYIAGYTYSTGNIASQGAYKEVLEGGGEAYFAQFDDSGNRLYGTYFGGDSQIDYGYDCSVDKDGSFYLVGETQSSSNISTSGAFKTSKSGVSDAYIAKFQVCPVSPDASAGPDSTICFGDSVILGSNPAATGGRGSYTYNWDPSGNLSSSSSPNPVVFPDSTTTYTLLVTDSFGCTGIDSVTININTLPVVDAGNDTAICENTNIGLGGNPTATGDAGGFSYDWRPGNLINDSTIANPTTNILSTTTYFLTVTDSLGCSNYDSNTVTVNPNPTADAGTDTSVCDGENVILGASPSASGGSGGYSYSWVPNIGLNNSNTSNPTASPQSTTTYHFTVTDLNGCTDSDSTTLVIYSLPNVNAGFDTVICYGDSAELGGSPTATGGQGDYIYSWYPDSTLNDTGISAPMAFPSMTTTFHLSVTDSTGCINNDSVQIQVNELPIADAGKDTSKCKGKSIILGGNPTASGGSGQYSYSWHPINGISDSLIANPTATLNSSSIFFLSVTDQNHCSAQDTVMITVNDVPVANAGADTIICKGDSINLGDNPAATGGTPPYTYQWSPPTEISSSNIADPVAYPSASSTYFLTVTDSNQCADEDTMNINMMVVDGGSNRTICEGDSVVIGGSPTASGGSGGYTFSWLPEETLSNQNSSNAIAYPSHSTTFSVYVTSSNGCTDSAQVSVNVNELPSINAGTDTIICKNKSIEIGGSPTASGGSTPYTYDWSPVNSLDLTSMSNPIASPEVSTLYHLSVTDANNCINRDSVLIEVDECVGINTQTNNVFNATVYPNPSQNRATLKFNSNGGKTTFRIISLSGSEIYGKTIDSPSGVLEQEFDFSFMSAGTYFLEINQEQHREILKFTKTK